MPQYIPLDTLRELRRKILVEKKRIDNLADTAGETEILFKKHILPVIKIYQPIISKLANHNSNSIYRARKCNNGVPFSNIKELYNPPSPSGRAFATNETPVLYGATSIQTALSETGAKIGDLIAIANFSYENLKAGQFWFVGQLGSFFKSQEETRYLEESNVIHKHFYTEPEIVNSLVFKDLLINELFSKISRPEDNYALNRFLIEEIKNGLSTDSNFKGVVFVSTKDAPGINFAIYGEAIKELKPQIVNLVKVTDIDEYGNICYKLLKNSNPSNGNLTW